jgi:20S proteasome alpha/beta subunit
METVIGIKFNDFVLIATDMTAAHSIMVMKDGKTFLKLVFYLPDSACTFVLR